MSRLTRTDLERLSATTDALDAPTTDAIVVALASPEKTIQRLAADLLPRAAPDARPAAVARLRTALGSDDAGWRWGAAYALGRLGLAEPAMIAPLLEVLGDRDGDRHWAASQLLALCARAHREPVVAALLAAVDDGEPVRRKMALYTLRDVAPADGEVHAATLRGLRDPAVGVRFAALAALIRLEPIPAEACSAVLALTRDDPDGGLRRAALCALGDVGRGVSAAESAIAAAEASAEPLLRRAASIARRRLGG
jgi:HEAT repeat protein